MKSNMSKMDLTKFKFPDINGLDIAFPTEKTNTELLAEARNRGFYNGHTEYNRLFSQLFFRGGKVKFKGGIDEEFKEKAWRYYRAFMGSFEPKHEEKEAICAMLLSELVEPDLS